MNTLVLLSLLLCAAYASYGLESITIEPNIPVSIYNVKPGEEIKIELEADNSGDQGFNYHWRLDSVEIDNKPAFQPNNPRFDWQDEHYEIPSVG